MSKNKRTKHQHYISKCYLENFSNPDNKKKTKKKTNLLWVYDYSKKRWRTSCPKAEGCENDFQTLIDEEGNKSDSLEEALAPLEGDFISVIRQIEETHCVPQNGKELRTLLFVMGLFAIRIPRVRKQLTNFASEVTNKIMGLFLKDERTWQSQVAKAYKSEDLDVDIVPYKEALAFFEEKRDIIKHDHMWVLQQLFPLELQIAN